MYATVDSFLRFARASLFFVLFIVILEGVGECRFMTISSQDGYHISGDLRIPLAWEKGESKTGVVLLHMYGSTKESWEPLVDFLAKKNIVTLAIDMRGHGASRFGPKGKDGLRQVLARDPEIFNHMYLDALAAIAYLTKDLGLDISQIGVVGASVGCSVAIHATVKLPGSLGAVVLLTPGENYLGVDSMQHIKKWSSQPLLILSSEEEKMRGATQIHMALAHHGAELVLFDEEDIHGTHMFGEVKGVEVKIAQWLQDKLTQSK